jgi:hypothetical protein
MLVYLLPTPYHFTIFDLPRHPCLELTDVCHQHLSARHGRRAVVMKKVKPFSAAAAQEFDVYKHSVLTKNVRNYFWVFLFVLCLVHCTFFVS